MTDDRSSMTFISRMTSWAWTRVHSATSVCDEVVTSFRRSDLDGILACDKDLGRQVQSSLVVSLGRAQDHLVLLGLRTAGEKIQAFLGSMAQRASRSGIQKLQMQQS